MKWGLYVKKLLCKKCGKPIKRSAKYCPECGDALIYIKNDNKTLDKHDKALKELPRSKPSTFAMLFTIIIGLIAFGVIVPVTIKVWKNNNYRLNSVEEFIKASNGKFNSDDFNVVKGTKLALLEKTIAKYGEITLRFGYFPYGNNYQYDDVFSIYTDEKPEYVICTFTTEFSEPNDNEIADYISEIITWVIYKSDHKKVCDMVNKVLADSYIPYSGYIDVSYKGYIIKISKSETTTEKTMYRIEIITEK